MAFRFLTYEIDSRSGAAEGLSADRSKFHSSPTVLGIVSGDSDTHVAPCLVSGHMITNLYDLIEHWDTVKERIREGEPRESISDVEIRAPLVGRDILAVAKNYRDHVKEMNVASVTADTSAGEPEVPMMFTKRATSIIPSGGKIYLHPHATRTVDYEGEMAIIIGKAGVNIKKADAWDHVWGATILNDVSARDRQKQHKQFYIGKSFDTFCPMGPFAVHTSNIDWNNMILETRVNGEVRQRQITTDTIFDIPTLIETCSSGITLQPGDVIATGTPAGVAAGRNPPPWLKAGDVVEVSVTGLGTLVNVVESGQVPPPPCEPIRNSSASVLAAAPTSPKFITLSSGKTLAFEVRTPPKKDPSLPLPTVLFIHGLGGCSFNFYSLIEASGISATHRVITFDGDGFGSSPLTPQASDYAPRIEAFVQDVHDLLDALAQKQPVAIVGHSMGCLIAAQFAIQYPERVDKLLLIAPAGPSSPATAEALASRAALVRQANSLHPMLDMILNLTLSRATRRNKILGPLARAIVRASMLSCTPEAYARASLAIASTSSIAYEKIRARTCVINGTEDKMTPRADGADIIYREVPGAELKMLPDVGHWPMLEALEETARALKAFLGGSARL